MSAQKIPLLSVTCNNIQCRWLIRGLCSARSITIHMSEVGLHKGVRVPMCETELEDGDHEPNT